MQVHTSPPISKFSANEVVGVSNHCRLFSDFSKLLTVTHTIVEGMIAIAISIGWIYLAQWSGQGRCIQVDSEVMAATFQFVHHFWIAPNDR